MVNAHMYLVSFDLHMYLFVDSNLSTSRRHSDMYMNSKLRYKTTSDLELSSLFRAN